ncbi:MAG: hypothetical protein H6818_22190 [Phycisphaerales bacterium]|nr:hypothetical protein [Phycisphaerales bacterium]MCB9862503.1 hypothetical protein [Phycisphaerales bacterium]
MHGKGKTGENAERQKSTRLKSREAPKPSAPSPDARNQRTRIRKILRHARVCTICAILRGAENRRNHRSMVRRQELSRANARANIARGAQTRFTLELGPNCADKQRLANEMQDAKSP